MAAEAEAAEALGGAQARTTPLVLGPGPDQLVELDAFVPELAAVAAHRLGLGGEHVLDVDPHVGLERP